MCARTLVDGIVAFEVNSASQAPSPKSYAQFPDYLQDSARIAGVGCLVLIPVGALIQASLAVCEVRTSTPRIEPPGTCDAVVVVYLVD